MRSKRGQIWIETVIYTLIGLSLIGLVLAIVTPKINEFRDRTIIEQTIDSLNVFDSKVDEVLSAPGNVRKIEFRMKRGSLYFNASDDLIEYIMEDSRSLFSQPNISITIGRINVTTTEGLKKHSISLVLGYSHNLTFEGSEENVTFSAVSVPYNFLIENRGFEDINRVNIDIKETS